MVSSKSLRIKAWNMLKGGNYWNLFIATLIFSLVFSINSLSAYLPAGSNLIAILIGAPISVGMATVYLNSFRQIKFRFEDLFEPFKTMYFKTLVLYILKLIYIVLWTLLFIIPGIIKALAYSLSSYIINDNPDLDANDAITKSKELMNGNKWRLFKLMFSYLGWIILGLLAFGVGIFFVIPYIEAGLTAFYLDVIKEEAANKEENTEKIESARATFGM